MNTLRAHLHLDGPLPTEVRFEVILWPTFNEKVGIRVLDTHLELWTHDAVTSLALDTRELQQRIREALDSKRANSERRGRDGFVVLIRDANTELERGTADDERDDPALRLARDLVTFLRAQEIEPATARLLSQIPSYFE